MGLREAHTDDSEHQDWPARPGNNGQETTCTGEELEPPRTGDTNRAVIFICDVGDCQVPAVL